jgi:hypothetical protein
VRDGPIQRNRKLARQSNGIGHMRSPVCGRPSRWHAPQRRCRSRKANSNSERSVRNRPTSADLAVHQSRRPSEVLRTCRPNDRHRVLTEPNSMSCAQPKFSGPAERVRLVMSTLFFTLITTSLYNSAPTTTGVKRAPVKVLPPFAPSNLPLPPSTLSGASGKMVIAPSSLAAPVPFHHSVDPSLHVRLYRCPLCNRL